MSGHTCRPTSADLKIFNYVHCHESRHRSGLNGWLCVRVCVYELVFARVWRECVCVCTCVRACVRASVCVCVEKKEKKVISTSVIPVPLSAGVFVWNWHRMTVLLKQPRLQIVPAVTALIYSAFKFTTRMRLHLLISRE